MATVHVMAIITAKPGKRAELLAAFQANVPNVHAEDGCLGYVATVDAEGASSAQTRFGEDSFAARPPRAWLAGPTTNVRPESQAPRSETSRDRYDVAFRLRSRVCCLATACAIDVP